MIQSPEFTQDVPTGFQVTSPPVAKLRTYLLPIDGHSLGEHGSYHRRILDQVTQTHVPCLGHGDVSTPTKDCHLIRSSRQGSLTLTSDPTTNGDEISEVKIVELLLPDKRGVGPTPEIRCARIRTHYKVVNRLVQKPIKKSLT